MSWLVLAGLVLHVGGIPTQAVYDKPVQLGESADATARIEWHDNEQDMTGLFDFFYQSSNIRPSVMSTHPDFAGTLFGSGVPISDTVNLLDWDTSAVPPGSYYIYEITRDPPLSPVYSVSPAPITVQHGGDPRWPAVVVDEPDGIGDTQPARFAVQWRATGEGPLTATIRYGEVLNDTLTEVAAGVPMVEAGAGSYEGCYLWNISLLAQGTYYVQVDVSDGARSHAAFSRNVLVVYRNPDAPDGGVEPACESAAGPDAGAGRDGPAVMGGDDDQPTCLCRAGGRGRAPLASAFACAAVLAALRARRRRAGAPPPGRRGR
jgi:hypothetical protein